ncbi:hypothetical protein SAICODRAFT_29856 [Saitoella complicata NRRL Y-17804]|uniref:uncharacterized protein n=1 Tax=Saitoella complicata (strain BCRC 22490 / CBS 7301 / JCM 7358 / NBRC 10748 / NRRL Y-17804) TaxID=698492 RepID=UPI00086805AD|nr:uncharacterized protein SAICODRAFT_29856 [Saitoella complicata NRRL Y-17804]ODQ53892.1 hypothetical protein SAICODRAFT_29856 [Saitoella complicata NRRL Y-17804]
MSSQSFPFSRLSQLRRAREISLAVAEPLVYSILLVGLIIMIRTTTATRMRNISSLCQKISIS